MLSAIVYSSATGSCEKYAKLLSAALHVPAMPLDKSPVRKDGEVIYIGWAMAGKTYGYSKAAKKLNVRALVQVGMTPVSEELRAQCRANNAVPEDVVVFVKQGGFHMKKTAPMFRPVMKLINKSVVKKLEGRTDLSDEEKATYNMAKTGDGEPASWDVSDVLAWAKKDWLDGSGKML